MSRRVGTPDEIARFDVLMDHASLVQKLDGLAERFPHLEHFGPRGPVRSVAQPSVERLVPEF